MSVQWADVSEFQPVINDAYPWPVVAFRSNDGTYRDRKFAANYAWAKAACDSGRLAFFIVYAVYEPDGGNWASTLISMVGNPHPRMVVMIDVESWNGRISGDHSADINAGRARLAQWLGNSRRVIGYGNVGDLNHLWPNKGDAQVVVAAYGTNPSYPNKIAHQYTSSASCAPFGSPVDMNSADGVDVPTLMAQLGLSPDVTGGGAQPFPILEDSMIHISSPSRGDAVVGPGYFRQLNSAEEVQQVGGVVTSSQVGNDRQFDLWKSIATTGTVTAPAAQPIELAAADVTAIEQAITTAIQAQPAADVNAIIAAVSRAVIAALPKSYSVTAS